MWPELMNAGKRNPNYTRRTRRQCNSYKALRWKGWRRVRRVDYWFFGRGEVVVDRGYAEPGAGRFVGEVGVS
jgi:hypothetical protein